MLILLFGLVLFVHNNNSRLNENRCNETNIFKERNKSRNPNIQQAKELFTNVTRQLKSGQDCRDLALVVLQVTRAKMCSWEGAH